VLFTDEMLIEMVFESDAEQVEDENGQMQDKNPEDMLIHKWATELTKHCVKMSLAEDYKLLDMVGKGGFGKVYQARHLDTGAIVGLKVIEKTRIKTMKNYVGLGIKLEVLVGRDQVH
jgi:serine/threonine protein kinase